jgi:hypothetical protein
VAAVAIGDFVFWCMFHITSYGSTQNFISAGLKMIRDLMYSETCAVSWGKRLEMFTREEFQNTFPNAVFRCLIQFDYSFVVCTKVLLQK